MSLPALLATVTDRIGAALPRLQQCEAHPGKFNIAELERFLTLSPAVRVAVVSVRWRPLDEGAVSGTAMLAAFVVASDKSRIGDKAVQAMEITETIARVAVNNDWGLADCRPAEDVESANLYSTDTGRKGVTLWSVGWRQTFRVGASPAETGKLESLYVGRTPRIGKRHKDDYREILP